MVPILYENSDFLIVNKPINIDFHGELGLLSRLREQSSQLYGVHRLDKATSGLMVFAKTKDSEKALKSLFQERQIQKFYIALTDIKPKKKMGQVKGDLIKARSGSYKLTRSMKNPSFTKFISYNYLSSLRMIIFRPFTGKTHQLRVVAQSLGASILGDIRYKGTSADRMYLHAFKLSFTLFNKDYDFTCLDTSGEFFEPLKTWNFSQIDWAYFIKETRKL